MANDETFKRNYCNKQANKVRLATYLKENTNEFLDPESLFDVQIKRLHEYKRQLLNVLHYVFV